MSNVEVVPGHWQSSRVEGPSNHALTIMAQSQTQIQGMLVLEGEVEVDYARILEEVKKRALRLDIDCLLISQDQALVNHFQRIVGICRQVVCLNNLRIAAISKATDEFEVCQGVCRPEHSLAFLRTFVPIRVSKRGPTLFCSTWALYRRDRPPCLECQSF